MLFTCSLEAAPLPGYSFFCLSRGIFGNGNVSGGCGQHCRALRSAELQNHLARSFRRKATPGPSHPESACRRLTYFIENAHELPIRVFFLSQVNDPHLHVLGLAAFCTNDPEAKNVVPGVYSPISSSLVLVNVVEPGIWAENFRDDDSVLLLVVLKHCRNDTRQSQ